MIKSKDSIEKYKICWQCSTEVGLLSVTVWVPTSKQVTPCNRTFSSSARPYMEWLLLEKWVKTSQWGWFPREGVFKRKMTWLLWHSCSLVYWLEKKNTLPWYCPKYYSINTDYSIITDKYYSINTDAVMKGFKIQNCSNTTHKNTSRTLLSMVQCW